MLPVFTAESRTASLKATVMPPPVSGCRMLSASPRMMRPEKLKDVKTRYYTYN